MYQKTNFSVLGGRCILLVFRAYAVISALAALVISRPIKHVGLACVPSYD